MFINRRTKAAVDTLLMFNVKKTSAYLIICFVVKTSSNLLFKEIYYYYLPNGLYFKYATFMLIQGKYAVKLNEFAITLVCDIQ